jgi:arylsulfatase
MVLSDNGASREGGPLGVMDEFSFFNAAWEDIDEIAANRLDDIGGPHSHSNYPWGWAQAGNSPLRWYKQNTYGGGVRDPLVVHWPREITDRGAIRQQFCHAVDITPTILSLTGAPVPDHHNGVPQIPMHGAPITATFSDPSAPAPRSIQYFEQMGHRGLWADGWKITTYHEQGRSIDDDQWGLYNLDDDFSECRDLSAQFPDKLRELIDAWWVEAGRHGVLPLDDRTIELFGGAPRPGTVHARKDYTYFPPVAHIPADASPPLGGRSWTIAADVRVPAGGIEGVIYARGGHNVGHSFFVKDGALHFDYNALGTHHRATAPLSLTSGRHQLSARFERDGKGGVLSLALDGEELTNVVIPKIVRMLGSTGLDVGRDGLSPVVDDYDPPYPFTGTIERITFRIRSRADAAEVAATARAELAKE